MKRIGVDVGGTFTDLIYVDDEKVEVYKTSTTPEDPSKGIMTGIEALCEITGTKPEEIDEIFHGTTIATNMVLEKKGSRVGLITTEGFRDVLHTARHKRTYNFSITQELPWQSTPLARRRDRYEVTERIVPPNGEVYKELDENQVRDVVKKLKNDGVSAIAVCFMFSFINPSHEERVREIIKEEIPDAYISLRSEVAPQFREYESFTTTCLNSYVGPKTAAYIDNLIKTLKDSGFVNANLHLMQSAGGVATGEAAAEKPVNLLMSGPVGGVLGAIWTTKLTGLKNVITLDIGGTSADLSVLSDLKPGMKHLLDTQVGGFTAMVPMIDISTIGAGGGSIAFIDEGGFFRVGPQSAGAVPGPACYDRGGVEPTVTDANILLGRLGTELLGGRMTIRPELAEKAIEEKLGKALDQSIEECALGIIDIMNNNMIQAIEKDSVRRGLDPRDFALFACGGAGALHACSVARALGMKNVIIPVNPGALCAVGLVTTDLLYDYSKTEMVMSTAMDYERLNRDYQNLESLALERLAEDKVADKDVTIARFAECRYQGQGYELRVPVLSGTLDEEKLETLKEEFHKAHEAFFGKFYPETPVEIATIRVEGVGAMPDFEATKIKEGTEDSSVAKTGSRETIFREGDEIKHYEAAIYDRSKLLAGNVVNGPAIINQMDTTIVVEPNCKATVNEYGVIVIDIA
ncbi:hydantoinase/oxoprolinase family protein [Eubacterium oxidoreducens]|uniref:N-methylhydantoinase A n=1 Tax=Eubacterium oxidoreducens TaxID=1732 RepID=A0A1G6C771_EUBOX|nr:hydantoinase/oxoprolinase family protein [Eubacterium oxidoreducens]SDB28740.1 N-methylhydantoinase A [Eubacterium oxidoreducens]